MKKLLPILLAAALMALLFIGVTQAHATSTDFISVWDTTKTSTGSSAYTQVTLPLESTGTYNFVASWGDGYTSTVTAWDDADKTHTYAVGGQYTVTVAGTCYGFRFNNTGDRLKLLDITQWGNLRVGNLNGYFYGCSNFNSTATDQLDLTGTTDMSNMFYGCSEFNYNISSWNTSSVTTMYYMFYGAIAFNQNLSSWDITSVTNMGSMFKNSGLTTENYDKILNCWSLQSVKSSVAFGVNSKTYDSGSPATARAHLISAHGWVITDGGASGSAWAEPVAAFSAAPLTGDPGMTVTFTDASTGTPTAWDWDFGDGTAHSTLQNPTHAYPATPGSYTVTETVTKDCISDAEVKTGYITVESPYIIWMD